MMSGLLLRVPFQRWEWISIEFHRRDRLTRWAMAGHARSTYHELMRNNNHREKSEEFKVDEIRGQR